MTKKKIKCKKRKTSVKCRPWKNLLQCIKVFVLHFFPPLLFRIFYAPNSHGWIDWERLMIDFFFRVICNKQWSKIQWKSNYSRICLMYAATDINGVLVERLITAHLSAMPRIIKVVQHLSALTFTWKIYICFDESAEASPWIPSTCTMADECCFAWFIDCGREGGRKKSSERQHWGGFVQGCHHTRRLHTSLCKRQNWPWLLRTYGTFQREFCVRWGKSSSCRRLAKDQSQLCPIANSNGHREKGWGLGVGRGRPGKWKGM